MSHSSEAFDALLNKLALTSTQQETIDSAVSGVITALVNGIENVTEDSISLQGSVASNTAIKPIRGGSYDVDLIAHSAEVEDTAESSLELIYSVFADHGTYADMVESRDPCVRINYADKGGISFHLDIVPVRTGQSTAPFDAPRKGQGWHGTDPDAFTAWCKMQGAAFRDTTKILKRWRDENSEVKSAVKSIIFQVLISSHIDSSEEYIANNILNALEGIANNLEPFATPPEIKNPVIGTEDLAARWEQKDYEEFKELINSAAIAARNAMEEEDEYTAQSLWQEILGEDFPILAEQAKDIFLDDDSHKNTLESQGWHEKIDGNYKIGITASIHKNNWSRKTITKNYDPEKSLPILAGSSICFEALPAFPEGSQPEIWFQVTNTGGHAATYEEGLRGEFLQSRDLDNKPLSNKTLTWESTKYMGIHYIEAFLVIENCVVARSGPFYVSIYSKDGRARSLKRSVLSR